MSDLEARLRALREAGRKALVVYLMAGARDDWVELAEAALNAGADAIEVGLPFSDPMIDGPVIQAAGLRALERGTTMESALRDLGDLGSRVPLVAMTYYNLFFHRGAARAAGQLADAGVAGALAPGPDPGGGRRSGAARATPPAWRRSSWWRRRRRPRARRAWPRPAGASSTRRRAWR